MLSFFFIKQNDLYLANDRIRAYYTNQQFVQDKLNAKFFLSKNNAIAMVVALGLDNLEIVED